MTSSKPRARLIIPLWGEIYADKLTTITLPAILAPGNLPALCESFSVELVLVTETRLFDRIKAAKSYAAAAGLCEIKLFPIDDLLTDTPGDYGVVLTYALYRGFIDLGERMTETYLLFLNADFIISDGSLRHLAKLMLRGERVIRAPSFRVILEEVWPQLEQKVDPVSAVLAIQPRDMVAMALKNKHITVRARTVNQKLCHQWRMDQFYWYVDDNTLIGYQLPVALVAIRPERVTLEPSLVWDYAFIPDAAPTLPKHFISDSDDFFMLEPQKRATGEDLVRLGWISPADIAADMQKWTTKDHRESGRELLKIHSADLPSLDAIVAESQKYLADVYGHLSGEPVAHDRHPLLGEWFKAAIGRMRGHRSPTGIDSAVPSNAAKLADTRKRHLAAVYSIIFGRVPEVRKIHPLWVDTAAAMSWIRTWRGKNVLWLSSSDSLFYRMMTNRVDPSALRQGGKSGMTFADNSFDACFCDLSVDDFKNFRELYSKIRPLVRDGGEACVFVYNKNMHTLNEADLNFCETALPDLDVSEIRFEGSRQTGIIRSIFMSAVNSNAGRPVVRELVSAAVLFGLLPLAYLFNTLAKALSGPTFRRTWSSLIVTFQVRKLGNR